MNVWTWLMKTKWINIVYRKYSVVIGKKYFKNNYIPEQNWAKQLKFNKCRTYLIMKETCGYHPVLTMTFSNTLDSRNLFSKFLSWSFFPFVICGRKQFCSEIGLIVSVGKLKEMPPSSLLKNNDNRGACFSFFVCVKFDIRKKAINASSHYVMSANCCAICNLLPCSAYFYIAV